MALIRPFQLPLALHNRRHHHTHIRVSPAPLPPGLPRQGEMAYALGSEIRRGSPKGQRRRILEESCFEAGGAGDVS
jgi:hypothetical protein